MKTKKRKVCVNRRAALLCLFFAFILTKAAAQDAEAQSNGAQSDETEKPVVLNLGFWPGFGINLVSKSPDAIVAVNIIASAQRAVTGFQLSGFANAVTENLSGAQVSTVFNSAKKRMRGAQIAGIVNISGDGSAGLQTSAAVNIARGSFSGVQIGGIVNIADKIEGVQIGVVNIAKEADGAAIGLLNFILDGVMSPAVYVDSSRNLYAQYQGGTKYLYTVLYAGTPWDFSGEYLIAGLGLGARIPAGRFFSFDFDVSVKQYQMLSNFEKKKKDGAPKEASKQQIQYPLASVKLSFNYSPFKHFSLFCGAAADLDFAHSVPARAASPMRFGNDIVTVHPSFFVGLKF